jgi:hypothetical protein
MQHIDKTMYSRSFHLYHSQRADIHPQEIFSSKDVCGSPVFPNHRECNDFPRTVRHDTVLEEFEFILKSFAPVVGPSLDHGLLRPWPPLVEENHDLPPRKNLGTAGGRKQEHLLDTSQWKDLRQNRRQFQSHGPELWN